MALETGYTRDYFIDPYGSYDPESTGSYYISGKPMFDLMNENDGTFSDKIIVTGIKSGEYRLAIDPDLVKKENIVKFTICKLNAAAFYDESIKTVRVFNTSLGSNILKFTIKAKNLIFLFLGFKETPVILFYR